jgi:TonB family protein
MPSANFYEELDFGIEALLAGEEPSSADGEMRELLALADELRFMPDLEFKMVLMEELDDVAVAGTTRPYALKTDKGGARGRRTLRDEQILPSLFGAGANAYPVNRGSFVASYLGQAAMLALIATSGFWMVQHRTDITQQLTSAIEISPYTLPPSAEETGGGGGGGTQEKLAASKGALPKTSREQITPPAIVISNASPKLPVPPTVVVPQLNIPQVGPLGDPISHVLGPASNGPGSSGGIGSGNDGGVGGGRGPGVGPGEGGGIGGGAYRIGGGVSSPVAIYDPDPEYSEEARKEKYQGTVVLWLVIGADGLPKQMRVQRSLGMGLDEKAMEAVKKWRFKPAMRNGQPVPVQVNVEVNFRLY